MIGWEGEKGMYDICTRSCLWACKMQKYDAIKSKTPGHYSG
jgi:hypothetical protein